MKTHLLLISFLFLMFACTNKSSLSFSNQEYSKKTILPCNENCSEIKLSVPNVDGTGDVVESINSKIFNAYKQLLSPEKGEYPVRNYNMLSDSFISEFENFKKEFPESAIFYTADLVGKVNYNSEQLINIEITYNIYKGGAHGSNGKASLILDPKTGDIIAKDNLFKDKNSFESFAEKAFRTKYKIPEQDSINSTGFQFAGNKFHLPKTILFTKDSLLLHYNDYEIGSYADGQKDLSFSFEEVKEFWSH